MTRQAPSVLLAIGTILIGVLLAVSWAMTTAVPETDDAGVGATDRPATPLSGTVVGDAERAQVPAGGPDNTVGSDAPKRGPGFVQALAGFRGRVIRSAGEVAPDTEVAILRIDSETLLHDRVDLLGEATHRPRLVAGRTKTDAGGRFLISGVWPGGFYVLHAGRGTDQVTTKIVPGAPGPGEIVDLGDVYLQAGAAIVGEVMDERGRPLVGAVIRAAPIPDHLLKAWPIGRFDPETPILRVDGDSRQVLEIPAWIRERLGELGIVTARSDDKGRFRLIGVQPDHVAVLVNAPDRRPSLHPSTSVVAGRETDLGRVKLERGATVKGRVLDEQGHAIAGAEVLIGQGTALVPFVFPSRAGPTDGDGRFSATGFGPGFVVAAVRHGPSASWVISDRHPFDRMLNLRIPGSCKLTLDVRGKTGEAVGKPVFKLLQAAPDADDIDLGLFGFRPPLAIRDRLSRLSDGRHQIRGLQKGRYVLLVGATGHAPRALSISLQADTDVTVDLVAQRVFEVVVTDSVGKPLPDVDVYVQAKGEFPRVPRLPLPCGRTAGDGRLKVTQATSNQVAVRVVHPAFGSAERAVQLPTAFVHIQLAEAGAVEGVLTEAGRPAPPRKWTLAVRRLEPAPTGMFELPRLAVPGADGRFRIVGLAPGKYEVSTVASTVAPPLGLALSPEAFARRFRSRDRRKVFPVHAGRTTHLEIETVAGRGAPDGPAVSVTGTMTVNGRPAQGFEVRGWHKRWLSSIVGPGGRFDLGQVAVGSAGLFVIDPKVAQQGRWEMLWWQRVRIEGEKPVELSIDLQLGSVSGTVVHSDGHGVSGCQVKLAGKIEGPTAKSVYTKFYGVTDRHGRFVLSSLPAGTYKATVWDRRVGRGTVRGITVGGGSRTTGITLRLQRVVSVTGRVEMKLFGSQAPQWSWLKLYGKDEQGRYVSSEWGAKVRSDGFFRIDGIPPGHYEVSIGAMFRKPGRALAWETRMFVHDSLLEVGTDGLRSVVLRPSARPHKPRPVEERRPVEQRKPAEKQASPQKGKESVR